jgi:hypothetical protein
VVIGLPQVFSPSQDLQIGRNMQSAHDFAADRNDVIDIVLNACLPRQSRRFFVKRPDHLRADPCGAAFALGHQPGDGVRDNLGTIGLGPRLVGLAHAVAVFCAPLLPLLLPLWSVLRIPLNVCTWIVLSPSGGVGVDALYASMRSAIDRRPSYVKGVERLFGIAITAGLDASAGQFGFAGAFSDERGFAPMADTGLAYIGCSASATVGPDSLELSALGETRQRLHLKTRTAPLGIRDRGSDHFPSLCASTMRLTSSAIEIPSRSASFFKKALCGSVNEIICLTTFACPSVWRDTKESLLCITRRGDINDGVISRGDPYSRVKFGDLRFQFVSLINKLVALMDQTLGVGVIAHRDRLHHISTDAISLNALAVTDVSLPLQRHSPQLFSSHDRMIPQGIQHRSVYAG